MSLRLFYNQFGIIQDLPQTSQVLFLGTQHNKPTLVFIPLSEYQSQNILNYTNCKQGLAIVCYQTVPANIYAAHK